MAGQIIVNGKFLGDALTGVQRHAWEIIRRLLDQRFPLSLIVPKDLEFHPAYKPLPRTGIVRSGVGRSHVWQQLVLPRKVDPAAILWTPSGMGPLLHRRQVLTVHDLSFLEHPEWFSKTYGFVYRLLLPLLMKRALHLITSSRFSQQRISQQLGIPVEQISVVPCGVNPSLTTSGADMQDERAIRRHYRLPERFVLALGSVEPRKNLGRLVQAVYALQREYPTLRLVLVGGQQAIYSGVDFPPETTHLIQHLGYVPNEHLSGIYKAATVFAYPSLYEGFGMPPLEAMACGTPVVTSNVTSLPEVVGDAALTVSPTDVPALTAAIARLLCEPELRRRLIDAGYQRITRFSWDQSSHQVAALFERLAAIT